MGNQHINIETNQLGCQRGEAIVLALGPAERHQKVFAFHIAEIAHTCAQRIYPTSVTGSGLGTQEPDAPYLALRLSEGERRHERPCAKRDYQFSALVHSITLVACTIIELGILMPRALAVFKLTI